MIKLIPQPYKVKLQEGYFDIAEGFELPIVDIISGRALDFVSYSVISNYDNIDLGKEGYVIEVKKDKINIKYEDLAGRFYALITLGQLCFNYNNVLPCMIIVDKPRLAYRGFMLDNGRYFYSVDEIKKLIDLCVLHKINTFHWHLTEDQGWRIEIKKYPLLTQIGSKRTHTNFNRKPHEGYYTQDQIRDIVAYCKERYISVIPEIDIPGHSVATLASYPYLGCFDRKLNVATHWGVKFDVLCVGKESTFKFLCDILDEITELFDSPYIHLGGDEVPHDRWKLCPDCNKKLKELNLENYTQLQVHFVNELSLYLKNKSKKVIVWGEFDEKINDVIMQIWHAEKQKSATELAKGLENKDYINSTSTYFYLDLPRRLVNLKNSYNYDPLIKGTDPERLIGAEIALWTEYVPNYATAIKRSLPRFCALSEIMWSYPENKNYTQFMENGNTFSKFLISNGYKCPKFSKGNIGKVSGFFDWLWFERRRLHWQGLHNIVDNAKVKRKYKK